MELLTTKIVESTGTMGAFKIEIILTSIKIN